MRSEITWAPLVDETLVLRGIRELKTQVKQLFCLSNRLLGNFDEKVFILGDGRSGTNWLIDILNHDKRFRLIYEPFHGWAFRPKLNETAEYPFPDLHRSRLAERFEKVKHGDYITKDVTIEFPRILYGGLLIKDISSHMIIDSLNAAMPELKKVLILRHPFAVVESKVRYPLYDWPTRPGYFLKGDLRVRTLLEPHLELIRETERRDDRHLMLVMIWCILHKLAFASRSISDFHIVFYENIAANPQTYAKELYDALGLEDRYQVNRRAIEATFSKPSRVTQSENAILSARQGRAGWKASMASEKIQAGLRILEAFGFENVYGDDHFPKVSANDLKTHLRESSDMAVK